jgi:predicted DNA-binding antitoxin AbrB/MazE fold protein
MSTVVFATFVDGVFKPDPPEQPLHLPPGTRVRLVVETFEELQKELDEFDQLCDAISVDSGGPILTREELYDRPSLWRLMYPEQQKEDR